MENGVADGSIAVNNRRSSMSIAALGALSDGSYPPVPSSLPHGVSVPERSTGSAIVDGPPLSSYADKAKPKARRASDATRLTKKEKAATGDLKCDQCGKAYKHGSCLTKHLYVVRSEMCSKSYADQRSGGSIRRNGNTHRSCLSRSINRCNSSRQHRCL